MRRLFAEPLGVRFRFAQALEFIDHVFRNVEADAPSDPLGRSLKMELRRALGRRFIREAKHRAVVSIEGLEAAFRQIREAASRRVHRLACLDIKSRGRKDRADADLMCGEDGETVAIGLDGVEPVL